MGTNPIAGFTYSQSYPGSQTNVRFSSKWFDPVNYHSHTVTWDFGDGATASGDFATHTYTSEGTFPITVTVTTDDSRVGSYTHDVSVVAHDAGVASVHAPSKASVGSTKTIRVDLTTVIHTEQVTVALYKRVGSDKYKQIRQQTGPVNQTGTFGFSYKFRPSDVGKVTFKAVTDLRAVQDDNLANNVGYGHTTVH